MENLLGVTDSGVMSQIKEEERKERIKVEGKGDSERQDRGWRGRGSVWRSLGFLLWLSYSFNEKKKLTAQSVHDDFG